jgi:hypothetical protein
MAAKKPATKKPAPAPPVGPKLCKSCGQVSPETVEKCLYCGETL